MKKRFRFLLFLLALLSLFASCSRTASFSIDQGGYRDGKTGVIYTHAPDNYRSTDDFVPEALVGTYRNPKSGKIISFYRVEGMDGVLTDENSELYLSPDASLPDFSDFSLAFAKLYLSGTTIYPICSFDADDAEQFRNAVLSGTSLDYGLIRPSLLRDSQYELVFFERELPLAYCLIYLELSEDLVISTDAGEVNYGSQFLYDRSIKTCYPIEKLTSERAS